VIWIVTDVEEIEEAYFSSGCERRKTLLLLLLLLWEDPREKEQGGVGGIYPVTNGVSAGKFGFVRLLEEGCSFI